MSTKSSKISPLGVKRVGVLGGGQLGRMMAYAAHRLGIPLTILDPLGEQSPAGQVALKAVRGDFNSAAAVAELAKDCDVITCEIEHVSAVGLRALEDQKSVLVYPSAHTISVIQDKFAQKQFFKAAGIAVPDFAEVSSEADVSAAAQTFGFPLVLKAKRLAYDGRGNLVISGPERVSSAFAELNQSLSRSAVAASGAGPTGPAGPASESPTYVERFVRFQKELAVMVARSPTGQVAVYPVTETRQRDSICHTTVAPVGADGTAAITRAVEQAAVQLARKAVETLGGVGIFGVELFLLESGEVILNEVAPRPHNSGHYTIEACCTDQFEQHLRAVTGLPLGDASLRVGAALMLNLIGEDTEAASMAPVAAALTVAGAGIHWYGKDAIKKGRKLGHITVTADTASQLQTRLAPLAQFIGAVNDGPQRRAPVVGIIMGSDSDLPSMKDAAAMLDRFGVAYELTIVSAHRTPDRMYSYAKEAHSRGLKAIIAGAGGAAHLPGMVAALTPLPVIGVPVLSSALSGKDSLLSIVQMPRGVPVATVAIGNSMNAGLLAVRMLASFEPELQRALIAYHEEMRAQVERAAERLESQGYAEYLAGMPKH